MVHRHGCGVAVFWLAVATVGGLGAAHGEGKTSPAMAAQALDRCWAVKMGMNSEEVGRVLGIHLGAQLGWLGAGSFPCDFRIKNFGVYEIQISYRLTAPPHEAMFADTLRRGIKDWGQPTWIDFSENRLKWYAIWSDNDRDEKTLSIEPKPTQEPVNTKDDSIIIYIWQKYPQK